MSSNNNIKPCCNENHIFHNALNCGYAQLDSLTTECCNEGSRQGLYSSVYVSREGDKVWRITPGDYAKAMTASRKLIK